MWVLPQETSKLRVCKTDGKGLKFSPEHEGGHFGIQTIQDKLVFFITEAKKLLWNDDMQVSDTTVDENLKVLLKF